MRSSVEPESVATTPRNDPDDLDFWSDSVTNLDVPVDPSWGAPRSDPRPFWHEDQSKVGHTTTRPKKRRISVTVERMLSD